MVIKGKRGKILLIILLGIFITFSIAVPVSADESEYVGSGVTTFLNSSILRTINSGCVFFRASATVLFPLPGRPVIHTAMPLISFDYYT